MDYAKIDAALAMALGDPESPDDRTLLVFIKMNTAPQGAEKSRLEEMGIKASSAGTVTATVSPNDVDELSEMPSIRSIRLSRRLRLTGA
jgi:hypothetical protein